MSIIINGKPLNEFIKEQKEKGEVLENVCGTQTFGFIKSRVSMSQVYGDHEGFLITDNARVTIARNGKRYTLEGNRIEKRDGQWYVDGKAVDWDAVGGKCETDAVSIEIHGNVQNLHTVSGDVKVVGDVQDINTTSGDVECQSAYNIHTMSGDVTCGSVGGNVTTLSGDINRR